MDYVPRITTAHKIAQAPRGERYTVLLYDQVKSPGPVQYAFLVAVIDNAAQEPVYFVASEVNTLAERVGGGSHFLAIFDARGHTNLGSSNDWGDPDRFFSEALDLVERAFPTEREQDSPPGA